MTDEEIRIEIARSVGWSGLEVEGFIRIEEARGEKGKIVPNYPEDLNAINEVVMSLENPSRGEYWDILYQLVRGHQFWGDDTSSELCFSVLVSTARQRAEAYLRVIGKWREG